MGYEVIYHYKEKLNGEFSEETKTYKKRIGDPYEELPPEKLASVIFGQLARRDIYVKDVEIYEITKKKIRESAEEDAQYPYCLIRNSS